VVGAANDENTIIALKSIDLIEEVAAYLVRHKRVEILKDQVAWRCLPR
jgi:hypothetical protein